MEAGFTDHPWSVEGLILLMLEPMAKKRSPYKSRQK
jgi:hypothetical protein